jgi:GT2 family glycosyltransferase
MICPEGLHDRGTHPTEPVGQRTIHTLVERMHPETAGDLVTRPAEVDTALGVQMLYEREMAEEIGGYDPGFSPVWFDDLDLALSARRLGLKVFYLPGIHVIHRMRLRGDRRKAKLRHRVRGSVTSLLPAEARRRLRRLERRNTPHPTHERRRLRHHYAYWRSKWGFDMLNPDLEQVTALYGDTEICWAYDPVRRTAGEEILAAWTVSA